ncbi:acyl-CoA dehydrogenase family protein [Nitriliruptor alkaliphilus]|uniref:acyl-CoA dehydrogenase family protein n=1 Tax=Nitriliruptor alkaliphilus TaxID=427918 RepID=UPI000695B1D0|nr:acyl-CoA dehydrogenase family protein [Nitriliruptor alkaliphilus]
MSTTTAPAAGLLTEERAAFTEALRDFARRECGTPQKLQELTDGGVESHHQGLYEQLGGLGYLGVGIDERFGGGGGSIADTCLLLEEVFYGKLPVFGITTSLTVAAALERHASDALKAELLPGLCTGEVHALGFSEPEAGSDLASLRCAARPSGDGWVVDGQKTWTSNAQHADHILLMVRTDPDVAKHRGITMLSVPMDTPGIEHRPIDTMGGREVNDVFFTDVEVGRDRLVGTENAGWTQLVDGLAAERLLIGAIFLGQARRALDDVVTFVREREQFGRTVGSFQAIRHRIADLATEVECCRLLVQDAIAATVADPDSLTGRRSSMVKLKVTETARRVALEGMQMMGGYGYAIEYGMERHVRNTLAATIYGGTSEVQREIIGGTYGL